MAMNGSVTAGRRTKRTHKKTILTWKVNLWPNSHEGGKSVYGLCSDRRQVLTGQTVPPLKQKQKPATNTRAHLEEALDGTLPVDTLFSSGHLFFMRKHSSASI